MREVRGSVVVRGWRKREAGRKSRVAEEKRSTSAAMYA